jgi:hydroxymethylglutaryl-CoA synthase
MAGYYLSSSQFSIEEMANALKLMDRLQSREKVNPSELDHALETRARMHPRVGAPFSLFILLWTF